MTPQILLYNIEPAHKNKIKRLLLQLKIRARVIEKEQYKSPVGILAGLSLLSLTPGEMPALSEALTDFSEEMLVFCFLEDATLNRFLSGLRKSGIRIPYKAVLTPVNACWNSLLLYQEISAEHKAMHGLNK